MRVTHTRKRTLESEWQSVVNLCHQAAWWPLAGSLEVIERMVPAAWRSVEDRGRRRRPSSTQKNACVCSRDVWLVECGFVTRVDLAKALGNDGTTALTMALLRFTECRAHSVSWTTQEDGAICRAWSHLVSRGSVELPRSSAGSHRHSALRARISSAGLVVPNCMFRVALLEGGTFVAGGHVPHKVEYHRACRGESTLQQEEEMYGVRNNGRTVLTVVRRQRCRPWVTLLSLC